MPWASVKLIIFSLLVFILIVAFAIAWVARKVRERKQNEDLAMRAFEREMEREFMNKGPETPEPENPAAPPFMAAPFIAATPPAPPAPDREAHPSPVSLIARLKETGIFVSEEGPYMPLDPSGESIMIRLKKDKTALIVPRFESEHFLSQALRRFDYVFLITHEGKIITLTKCDDYLASQWPG